MRPKIGLVIFYLLGTFTLKNVFCHEYDHETEELIWSEDFDELEESKWNFMVSNYPDGDLAFYRHNLSNQYVSDGILHIDHTFTGFDYGEEFLYNGELDLYTLDPEHPCNQKWSPELYCTQSSGPDILPPITGTRMDTSGKFSFKFGRVEIKVKHMLGDWVRTAVWMVSQKSVYGNFPRSGEIDISEGDGMRTLQCGSKSRGIDWFQDNLHYGPSNDDRVQFNMEHWDNENNFADNWHTIGIVWTDTYLAYILDGEETRRITPPEGGMWELGNFTGPNIYEDGTIMAPFDEEFYFILSTAPGVMWPWSDNCDPLHPWNPDSEDPGRQLWEAKETWLPSFQQPFMIDYIKVYQDSYQRSEK